MSVIVCSGATERKGLLQDLEKSLFSSSIPFMLYPVPPMPGGPNDMTIQRKISFIRQCADNAKGFSRVVIADAWDVLFVGTAEELEAKIPETVLISAERSCYPEPDLAGLFMKPSKWRFCNAGLMSGSPQSLLEWCDEAEKTADQGELDQKWMNRRYCEGSPLTPIDWETNIFYTVSQFEDGSLTVLDGKVVNIDHSTRPQFFHFSGGCSPEHFQQMLTYGGPLF
jgi:hypothetical protein